MGRDRKMKMLVIVAFVIAIASMSLGFAAFSSVLNISSSATVTPNSEDFNIVFSGSETDANVKALVPSITGSAIAENAIVGDDGISISANEIIFTEPGQKVTYYTYAHNIGKFDGYVNSVTFENVDGYDKNVVCIPDEGTSAELVQAACEGIQIGYLFPSGRGGLLEITTSSGVMTYLVGSVSSGGFFMQYGSNATRADGPFTVLFGDVVYDISTVK